MPEETNPFEFETETSKHESALTKEILSALQAKIATIPEAEAAAILRAAAEAVQDRQKSSEILSMIIGTVGRVIGIVL